MRAILLISIFSAISVLTGITGWLAVHFTAKHRKHLTEHQREHWLFRLRWALLAMAAIETASYFFAMPRILGHSPIPAWASLFPILCAANLGLLCAATVRMEWVFRKADGVAPAIWKTAAKIFLVETLSWGGALFFGVGIYDGTRMVVLRWAKLWWDGGVEAPVLAIAIGLAVASRFFFHPWVTRWVFRTSLIENQPFQELVAKVYGAFHLVPPIIYDLKTSPLAGVRASRQTLLARLGLRGRQALISSQILEKLSASEQESLLFREAAHDYLQLSRFKLAAAVLAAETLLVLRLVFIQIQVPLSVLFGLDSRVVLFWIPLAGTATFLGLATWWYRRQTLDRQFTADLFCVEAMKADRASLVMGLEKIADDTAQMPKALAERLAALENGLSVPALVTVAPEPEPKRFHLGQQQRLAASFGSVALAILVLSFSSAGHRLTLQVKMALAIHAHDVQRLAALLAQGANPNRENILGITPVSAAAGSGDIALLKELLDHGGAVRDENLPHQPLHEAVLHGRSDVVAFLLDKGALANDPDFFGRTPLMIAADAGQVEVATLLLQHGAKISLRDPAGHTALQIAEKKGNQGVARLIRNASAGPLVRVR